jgi:uncharacterized protein YdaU (DUF1376 family)
MPLYVPDFLADTGRLSAAETGAYMCLIMEYWMHDGLPDDDAKLAQIARLPLKSWRQMRPTIQAFFRDGWRHKRIDAELEKMITTMTRRHTAAVKAGTMSVISRERNRQRNVQRPLNESLPQRSTSDQRSVNHTTQERKITTTTSEAAREVPPVDNPENPEKPAPEPAETPAGSPAKGANLSASPELLASLARKYR